MTSINYYKAKLIGLCPFFKRSSKIKKYTGVFYLLRHNLPNHCLKRQSTSISFKILTLLIPAPHVKRSHHSPWTPSPLSHPKKWQTMNSKSRQYLMWAFGSIFSEMCIFSKQISRWTTIYQNVNSDSKTNQSTKIRFLKQHYFEISSLFGIHSLPMCHT